MKNMKYPAAWTPTVVTAKKIESRIDMSADVAGKGKCPECRQPMEVVSVSGSPMWTCQKDRITLPVPDGYEA